MRTMTTPTPPPHPIPAGGMGTARIINWCKVTPETEERSSHNNAKLKVRGTYMNTVSNFLTLVGDNIK